MNTPMNANALKVAGLTPVCSLKDCYFQTLQRLYAEFPRGYVEPDVLLHLLYGDRLASAQAFFKHRLPPHAVVFFTIRWHTSEGYDQLRVLFTLLHLCFASFPNIFLDEMAFHEAYTEFEKWRGGGK